MSQLAFKFNDYIPQLRIVEKPKARTVISSPMAVSAFTPLQREYITALDCVMARMPANRTRENWLHLYTGIPIDPTRDNRYGISVALDDVRREKHWAGGAWLRIRYGDKAIVVSEDHCELVDGGKRGSRWITHATRIYSHMPFETFIHLMDEVAMLYGKRIAAPNIPRWHWSVK